MTNETIDLIKRLLFPRGFLKWGYIAFILAMLTAGTILVDLTGGTRWAYLHVMYFPIVFAGLIFSIPGGIITGILAGLLLGPGMLMNNDLAFYQPLTSWVWRLVIFALVGAVAGMGSSVFRSYLRELEIKHNTDPTTGLPNLRGLKQYFRDFMDTGHKSMSIVVIDLYQIPQIDQALGTEGTIELIRQAAQNLVTALGEMCIVGHLHSKRFALVIPNDSDLHIVLEKCNEIAEENYEFEGIPLFVEMRFGIANYPEDDRDLASLTRKARIAIESAERDSKRFGYYEASAGANAERNLLILHQLKKAIENRTLDLHYQPKLDLKSGAPIGVEALVRWTDPILGKVPPMDFIPLTEETSLINPFTKWLIEKAVLKVKELHQAGFEIQVSINFSMKNFLDPTVLEHLDALLEKHKIGSSYLEIEVTETAVATNIHNVAEILNTLRKKGIRIAVDDFGTGQSSQHYLFELPVDVIKVDKMFVGEVERSNAASAIVRSSITLGHELGLEVVAEGIETKEQAKLLKKWGCDMGQGYFFSHPLPSEDLINWLELYKPILQRKS